MCQEKSAVDSTGISNRPSLITQPRFWIGTWATLDCYAAQVTATRARGALNQQVRADGPPCPWPRAISPDDLPAARFLYSPNTRRLCSSRISSAMLVLDNRTNSANGAFGRHERQDSAGMRLGRSIISEAAQPP
jgi:hypothetical protein